MLIEATLYFTFGSLLVGFWVYFTGWWLFYVLPTIGKVFPRKIGIVFGKLTNNLKLWGKLIKMSENSGNIDARVQEFMKNFRKVSGNHEFFLGKSRQIFLSSERRKIEKFLWKNEENENFGKNSGKTNVIINKSVKTHRKILENYY